VRKARVAEVMPSVSVDTGSDSGTTVGPNAETEIGSAQDVLALYEAPSGIDSAPLWGEMRAEGLNPQRCNWFRACVLRLKRRQEYRSFHPMSP